MNNKTLSEPKTKALRICLFIDSLANGGAQRQIVNLAIGLKTRKHDVHLVTYYPNFHHLDKLINEGIIHHHFEKTHRFDLKPIFAIRKLLNEKKIDSLVAFLRTPSIYSEMACIAKPEVALLVSERCGVRQGGLLLHELFTGLLHVFSDAVISNSNAYNSELSSKLPFLKNKSLTIHNGIADVFLEQGRKRIASFENQPHGNNDFLAMCVVAARPTPAKGLMPLLKAVKNLRDNGHTNFRIDWIGPADNHYPLFVEASEFIHQHKLTSYWRWLGPKSNIQTLYNDYDAHILPSLLEGVANVLCEAMACGLPSIATKIADNEEIVIDNVSGLLCEPDDPISLSRSIELLIKTSHIDRQIMSKRAHEQALSLFSTKNFITQWENIIIANLKT